MSQWRLGARLLPLLRQLPRQQEAADVAHEGVNRSPRVTTESEDDPQEMNSDRR